LKHGLLHGFKSLIIIDFIGITAYLRNSLLHGLKHGLLHGLLHGLAKNETYFT